MIRAGMDIARLNFSHGEFDDHRRNIESLRAAAQAAGRDVAIMADLPGPKIRLGTIEGEPVELARGKPSRSRPRRSTGGPQPRFRRFSAAAAGGEARRQALRERRPRAARGRASRRQRRPLPRGGRRRDRARARASTCPGIDLGIRAFTDRDRRCLEFALENGVDAVSQSFVESADDVERRARGGSRPRPPAVRHRQDRAGPGARSRSTRFSPPPTVS